MIPGSVGAPSAGSKRMLQIKTSDEECDVKVPMTGKSGTVCWDDNGLLSTRKNAAKAKILTEEATTGDMEVEEGPTKITAVIDDANKADVARSSATDGVQAGTTANSSPSTPRVYDHGKKTPYSQVVVLLIAITTDR